MGHRLFLVLARKTKLTRLLPTVWNLKPGILPVIESEAITTPFLSAALEELSGRCAGQQLPCLIFLYSIGRA